MKYHVNHVKAFKPVYCKGKSKVLILGTCPGYNSLDRGFYYMDSSNSFWEIIDYVTGNKNFFSDRKKQYIKANKTERNIIKKEIISKLHKHGIAVYDVVESCIRDTAADKGIILDSIKYTNIKQMCKDVKLIIINGKSTSKKYNTYSLFKKSIGCVPLEKVKLVYSSSGACSKKVAAKKQNWKNAISKYC